MVHRVHIAAGAAATFMFGIGAAGAADYIPEQPIIIEQPVIEYSPPPYYSRFDCGVAFNGDADLRVSSPELHFVEKNGGHVKTGDAWTCDMGIGHWVTQNVRVDATIEYRSAFDVEGVADPDVIDSLSQDTNVQSFVGLFNAYWDIANYNGVTPYIGGGIGFAHNQIDDIFIAESGFVTQGGETTEFAWALMAGLAFDISPDLILDVGYRYIDLGDVKSGIVGSDGGTTSPVLVRDMDAHEIRIGFRYEFY